MYSFEENGHYSSNTLIGPIAVEDMNGVTLLSIFASVIILEISEESSN